MMHYFKIIQVDTTITSTTDKVCSAHFCTNSASELVVDRENNSQSGAWSQKMKPIRACLYPVSSVHEDIFIIGRK